MRILQFSLLALVLSLLMSACDRKEPRSTETEPSKSQTTPAAATETVAAEPPPVVEAATPEKRVEAKAERLSPESVPGLYRDPFAPEVLYEFGEGDRWSATWETRDGSRGLMMEGMYQIERGEVLHLLVMQFGRRGAGSLGDWDLRTPPQPRPRGYFRIEGNELVIMPARTASAFTMSPFTAARLVKVAE